MSVNEKIHKCLKEGDKGEQRHKGIRKISADENKIADHIRKAIHNMEAMLFFKEHGFGDWAISAGFYVLYHLLLALLVKEGFESKNQSCTFALVEKMIEERKISLTKKELEYIYNSEIDLEQSTTILDLREKYQYSTQTETEEQEWQEFKSKIKTLFDKIRKDIEG